MSDDRGKFSYPVLRSDAIILNLRELNIHIEKENLLKPHPDVLRQVYIRLFEAVHFTTREEIEQFSFEAMGQLEHPELFKTSIAQVAFFKKMTEFAHIVQFHSFRKSDLDHPEPKRVCHLLSAIINFIKYREEHVVRFDEMGAHTRMLREQRRDLEVEVRELDDLMKDIDAQRAEEAPMVEELKEEVTELQRQVDELNNKQATIRAETAVKKERCEELIAKKKSEELLLVSLQEECRRLRGQIVEDPEELKRTVKALEATLRTESASLVTTQARDKSLHARHNVLDKVNKDVSRCNDLLNDYEAEVEKLESTKRQIKEMKPMIADLERTLVEKETKEKHLIRQCTAIQEKQERFKAKSTEKAQQLLQTLKETQTHSADADKENSDKQSKIEEMQEEITAGRNRLREIKREHASHMATMQAQYEQLETQVQGFHHRMFKVLKASS